MSDDDRNDIDDITDRLYDAIQRYNEEVEDYKEKELRMLRDDDKDDIN